MTAIRIAIVTVADDLHALSVAHHIRARSQTDCVIVEANQVSASGCLSWGGHPDEGSSLCSSGGRIPTSSIDAIWWRRANAHQLGAATLEPLHEDLIHNDCRFALRGILLTDFRGAWISTPHATEYADNKLVQMRTALKAGFRLPRTLVSNDPGAIRDFCGALENQVVVKAVHGTRLAGGIPARNVTAEALASDDSLRVCPTIYQEHVRGRFHIRAHVFGDQVHAAMLESGRLDWRLDLTTPMACWTPPATLCAQLREVVCQLGLRMGIVDMKLTEEGEPVWLEINPQGQFLFVEALAEMPLSELLAAFLCSEASRHDRQ